MLTKQHRQEGLCKAYVRAIAAQVGLICSEPGQDYGIDLCLRAVRQRGRRRADVSGQLDLQLKSTTRAQVGDSHIQVDLETKTYEDLREKGDNCPRILVVLLLPTDEGDWVSQSAEELVLRRGAYWLSLEGSPPAKTGKTVRIAIPRSNLFSAQAVLGIMASLRERKES